MRSTSPNSRSPPASIPTPASDNRPEGGTTNPVPSPLATESEPNHGVSSYPKVNPGIYVIDTPGIYSVEAEGFVKADFRQSGTPTPPIYVINTALFNSVHSTQPSVVPPPIPSDPVPPGSSSTDSELSWTSSPGEIKKRRVWGRVRALKIIKAPPPFTYRTLKKNFRRFRALHRYDKTLRFGKPEFRYARGEVFGEREWFKGKTKRGMLALVAKPGGVKGLGASKNASGYDSDVDLCEIVISEMVESDTDFDEEEELNSLLDEGRKYADANGEWSLLMGLGA